MKTALMTIATGEVYQQYAMNMFKSADKYFPKHDQVVFTDDPFKMLGHYVGTAIQVPKYGYPHATLYRYKMFVDAEQTLSNYDQLFFIDSDMEFVDHPGDIIFSPGLMATQHPGFFGRKGSFETNQASMAYCPEGITYFCGGFQGGRSDKYLSAAEEMAYLIGYDESRGVLAQWHDESHWNAYLFKNPPDRILTPSYCYPEDYDGGYGWTKEQFPPILVALDKRKRGNHPRFVVK